jgi:predicted permease
MSVWLDFRYALRMLRRSPVVSAIIILTLALCIGANSAIFSVIDATLLRPLAYPQPDRLARVVTHFRAHGTEGDQTQQDGAAWDLVRDHATFLEAAVYSDGSGGVNFASGGTAQYVQQQRVSAGFFRVLGVQPMIGREFSRQEDRSGGPAVVVLSHHFWRRFFHEDPSVLGRSINLRGEAYTVVGVMPENFYSSAAADVWTPLKPSTTGEGEGTNYAIAARLKPGVTWPQADAQIEAVGASMIAEKKLLGKDVFARLHLVSLQRGETENFRRPLLIVWAAVGLVLLIGCANVTSLLLARAGARSREIATRMALGGGRRAVARQLLVESLVLAVLGGIGGLVVASWGLHALQTLAANSFPITQAVGLDARVLAATACLSLLASLLAGVFPAIEAGSVDIRAALTEAGTRGVAGARRRWTRSLLVSGEVALAVLLLVGAGLLIRTLAHLYQLRPGFDPANVIAASFSLQDARYATAQKVSRLFDSGLARIRELPGVESAAAGLSLPYQRGLNVGFRRLDGPEASQEYLTTDFNYVTPDYFHTLRIPLLRGRAFQASDGPKSAQVVIVNDAFVKRYLAKQAPLGSHLFFDPTPLEVVGVVGDVQETAGWGNYGPLGAVPMVYIPASQTSDGFVKSVHIWFSPNWIVRASGPPETVIRGIQHVATTIDPLLPIAAFRTMREIRSQRLGEQRFQATLLATLSGLALLLAIVGIYGLMSQSVVERRRELGIRLALGSSRVRAIRDAALPGILLGLAGVAAGCILAALSVKVLEHLIWGVSATDPLTFASVALALLFVAGLASVIPALRIARLNPADTLREE